AANHTSPGSGIPFQRFQPMRLCSSSGVCRLRGAGFGFLMGAPAFELPRLAKAAANCANLRLPALSDKNSTPAAFKGALDGGLSGGDAFAVTCLEASDRSRADMGGNGELLHAPSDARPWPSCSEPPYHEGVDASRSSE